MHTSDKRENTKTPTDLNKAGKDPATIIKAEHFLTGSLVHELDENNEDSDIYLNNLDEYDNDDPESNASSQTASFTPDPFSQYLSTLEQSFIEQKTLHDVTVCSEQINQIIMAKFISKELKAKMLAELILKQNDVISDLLDYYNTYEIKND